jgi:hypothetical protein
MDTSGGRGSIALSTSITIVANRQFGRRAVKIAGPIAIRTSDDLLRTDAKTPAEADAAD